MLASAVPDCERLEVINFSTPRLLEHGMASEDQPDRLRSKYAQIRADQQSALDELARDLQDAKSRRGGERITANTLIRVAIDVVLACGPRLSGDTEQELREGLFQQLGIQTSEAD